MSPYRIPVFNEIAEDKRFDFEVIFLVEMAGGRKWRVEKEKIKFDYRVMSGVGIPLPRRFPIFFNPSIFWTLSRINPDVVICGGYQHPSFLIAFFYARLYRKKFVLWSESHALSIRLRQPWVMAYRKMIVKYCSACIVPGELARRFLRDLGAEEKQTFVAPNAVANDFFYQSSRVFRSQKERFKAERQFPRLLILYIGRLIDSKGVRLLLEAFSKLSDQKEVGLLLVGDGACETSYRSFCAQHHLDNVFFEGFKQQEELPFYYGIADVMVMPSFRDEWGLVLNEAMAACLPVVASDRAGAAHDLIQQGVNGYRFTAGDSDELAHWINRLLKNDALRNRMGECSFETIQQFSPRRCARGFVDAIFYVLNGTRECIKEEQTLQIS